MVEAPKFIGPEYKGRTILFEGIRIQWDKGSWVFRHTQKRDESIDTYSIWNPKNWEEIAERLAKGQICAMYTMGNFGVGEVVQPPEWTKPGEEDNQYVIHDKIKGRDRAIKNVAFIPPEDIGSFIDIDWYDKDQKYLRWASGRAKTYVGPQHNKFRVRKGAQISPALVREDDQTAACFWIPGHWGFEEIAKHMRKKVKHGHFSGSSLNRHGKEPCYTTSELYETLSSDEKWLETINFIIFDELAEAEEIGRSQTMLFFDKNNVTVARLGSLSPQAISAKTGIPIHLNQEDVELNRVEIASKKRESDSYSLNDNSESDRRVEAVMGRIKRFKVWYGLNYLGRRSHL